MRRQNGIGALFTRKFVLDFSVVVIVARRGRTIFVSVAEPQMAGVASF